MDGKKVVDWFEHSGKLWLLRIVALSLAAFSLLSSFDVISKSYLKPEFMYAAIFLLLWLMFELFLSLWSSNMPQGDGAIPLLLWHKAIPEILAAVGRTQTTLRILGSSTESFFIPMKDTIEHLSHIHIQLIMRRASSDDNDRLTKLAQYHSYWMDLRSEERKVTVEIKYSSNEILRAVIVDSSEALVGFYEKRGSKLWGHTVPLMHVRRGNPIGDHLIYIYTNRFEQMWLETDDWTPPKGTRDGAAARQGHK